MPFEFPESFNALTEDQITIVKKQVVQQFSHGIFIAGITLTPSVPRITISGTPITYGSSALVVGTSILPVASKVRLPLSKVRLPLSVNALTEGQFTTFNEQEVQQFSHDISIAGTTLTLEAPPVTVSGTPIAYGPSTLVVGTSTIPLAIQASESLITTVTGHAITATPSAVEVAGTRLRPGVSGVTLDGTVVCLDKAGQLVVGSRTLSLTGESAGLGRLILGGFGDESPSKISNPFIIIIAGETTTAVSIAVVFASTLLTPGAHGKTINGTLVFLDTAGQLVVDSKTIALESTSAISGGLIMGGFGAAGPFGSILPPATRERISNGSSNVTNNGRNDSRESKGFEKLFVGEAGGRTNNGDNCIQADVKSQDRPLESVIARPVIRYQELLIFFMQCFRALHKETSAQPRLHHHHFRGLKQRV